MNRKLLALLLVTLMTFTVLVGCSQPAEEPAEAPEETPAEAPEETPAEGNAEGYPDKPINVIVSYSAGGGTDVGARILLPYVEEELGVPLNVVNKPGGGGWVGWTDLTNADPDGYTIGYINTPNLITGYLDPQYNRTDKSIDSFDLIGNHVLDYGAVAVKIDDDRFDTVEDLMEYAKENDLIAASTGAGSDDHIAQLRLNQEFDTQFVNLATSGASEGKAALLGGHIDVWFANVGEVAVPNENGEVKVLGVLSEERSQFMPEVPTFEESGYPGVYTWSARGLAAPDGMDPAVLEILVEAFDKAINNPEQIEKMNEMGLAVHHLKGDEYYEFLESDVNNVKAVSELLGY
ncbi:tripartite tricarboxylate transporter substrate binding protein [Gudongella sp. DL1XJH-153]|uniref:tripartite tricarboxylate transporter substrate binding protein n=1 Tax=Gudongella sp. DL1XJH-153 TaxID=3409804 RepID=UPI003BB5438B